MEPHGILWNVTESHGISQNSAEPYGIQIPATRLISPQWPLSTGRAMGRKPPMVPAVQCEWSTAAIRDISS
jgi:hypothetical protein